MDERKKQFRVGVTVFGAMILAALLILANSDFSWSPWRKQYQLQLLVDQAPGVAPDTPVRRRGILIGRVAEVLDTDEGALITMNIDEEKTIKTNEVGRIQTSLIGDAVIDFTPGGDPARAQPVAPGGAPIKGMYNPSPLDLIANLQGDLKQTIISLGNAGDEVARLAEQINAVIGDQDVERLNRLLTTVEDAMTSLSSVMAGVDDIVGDDEFRAQLKEGLSQLPSLVSDSRAIMEVLEVAVTSADQNLKNLQGFTGPLGERGPEIIDSLESGVDNLSELLGETALLAKSINKSDGTIGKLIHDDAIFRELTKAVSQASATVADLRRMINDPLLQRRIRMILDNIYVLTDKLARDPARIVRGVIPRNRELPLK